MAKKVRHRLEVSGTGRFPVDMLRYDACYPASSKDVEKLCATLYGDRPPRGPWTIEVASQVTAPWALERWTSFGCKMVEKSY